MTEPRDTHFFAAKRQIQEVAEAVVQVYLRRALDAAHEGRADDMEAIFCGLRDYCPLLSPSAEEAKGLIRAALAGPPS